MGSLDVLPSQMRSSMVSKSTNAEYVEFDLGDKHCRGLTRKCFCKDGDTVNVVARVKDEHYEIYAIAKPETQIISLYPHCVRGSQILWKQTIQAWLIKSAILGSLCAVIMFLHATEVAERKLNPELSWTVFLDIFLYVLLIIAGVASWEKRKLEKEIQFANFSDICFETLDFPDPKNIDLNVFNNEYYGKNEVNYITFRYPDPVNSKSL
jgi:hypothetical protein